MWLLCGADIWLELGWLGLAWLGLAWLGAGGAGSGWLGFESSKTGWIWKMGNVS